MVEDKSKRDDRRGMIKVGRGWGKTMYKGWKSRECEYNM
jgi:hypothetical protein